MNKVGGLSATDKVLVAVETSPLTMREIAARLRIEADSVRNMLNGLRTRRLVERESDAAGPFFGRAAARWKLTEAGRVRLSQVRGEADGDATRSSASQA